MQRTAKLLDEQQYLAAHAAISQKPFEYYTALPPVLPFKESNQVCTPYAGGCGQRHVTGEVVERFSDLTMGVATRPNTRATTELFGSAPFKARGDGMLKNPDAYSQLTMSGFNPHCAKRFAAEVDYDRFDCINAPLQVEDPRVMGPRGGAATRAGPGYYLC